MKRALPWISAAAIIVIVFGTVFATVQQAQRSAANDPQIQLAEDAATALDSGKTLAAVAAGSVSMNESLAPFVIVYDKLGNPVAGSAKLDGKLPVAPIGILRAAESHEYHAISWQPQGNLRFAAVTVATEKYYVLAGRSLKEIEKREDTTKLLVSIGCLGSLVVLAIVYLASQPRKRK